MLLCAGMNLVIDRVKDERELIKALNEVATSYAGVTVASNRHRPVTLTAVSVRARMRRSQLGQPWGRPVWELAAVSRGAPRRPRNPRTPRCYSGCRFDPTSVGLGTTGEEVRLARLQDRSQDVELTAEGVRRSLRNVDPEPVFTHAVRIDGRLFPVVQALEVASGITRGQTRSARARDVLTRLGFELIDSNLRSPITATAPGPPTAPAPAVLATAPSGPWARYGYACEAIDALSEATTAAVPSFPDEFPIVEQLSRRMSARVEELRRRAKYD